MGCDIHCYIEYKETYGWVSFGERINPGRNYHLFGRIAGVRDPSEELVVPPRGRPDDLGFRSRDDAWLYVPPGPGDFVVEGWADPEDAKRWVAEGLSTFSPDGRYVSHPDHHTHTWLTPDEFARAIEGDVHALEYRAMLAAMRSLEADGKQVRVVIWFDN
jgi:hypothetical protein